MKALLKNPLVQLFLSILMAFGFTFAEAYAALPTGIATGISGVQTDALALIDLVWPVVIAIFGGMVLFKIFKRVGSKI